MVDVNGVNELERFRIFPSIASVEEGTLKLLEEGDFDLSLKDFGIIELNLLCLGGGGG